jgi:RNA polymerase sigma factor (sigma-70 family)
VRLNNRKSHELLIAKDIVSVTSLTLLERLRVKPSAADWQRFHDAYLPLIRVWLMRVPGLRDEVDDLSQEVLIVVVREVAGFERQRQGSFRAWLRQITVNRIRSCWRKRARRPLVGVADTSTEDFLGQLEDPASALASQWDREHDRHVFDHLLATVKDDFQAETWEAFRRFVLDGVPAAKVAQELGVSTNAVILAKARILKRLRDEAGGLLD